MVLVIGDKPILVSEENGHRVNKEKLVISFGPLDKKSNVNEFDGIGNVILVTVNGKPRAFYVEESGTLYRHDGHPMGKGHVVLATQDRGCRIAMTLQRVNPSSFTYKVSDFCYTEDRTGIAF